MDNTITKYPVFSNYHASTDYLLGIGALKNIFYLNIKEEGVTIPLFVRHLEDGFCDLFSPIGFQPHIKTEFWQALLTGFKELIKNINGLLSLYILCKNDLSEFDPPYGMDFSRKITNYYIDLTFNYDRWLMEQKTDARQRLRKIIQTITEYENVKNQVSREFVEHYRRIAQARKFSSLYTFSRENFNRIIRTDQIVYMELRKNGEFIAGGFWGCDRLDVDYLFGADNPKFDDGIRLLIHEARKHFKSCGFEKLFLGGGIKERDSLARYKQRMGTKAQICSTVRAFLDIPHAERLIGEPFSNKWFNGYFPPYAAR